MRFAFYGRVSTEDQQDPESSRQWQLRRSREVIAAVEGDVVTEYFDVGQSRSLPWKRRPEASRLLLDLGRPDRGFDAVVIGEPQRAFYGGQFGNTFPVLTHWGVELWVPEVGGRVDPDSEAHDLMMMLFGGMSKSERTRVQKRVRSSMGAQAEIQGRFLGGRPPYGYRLGDAGPHPNPEKARDGKRLHRLEPDPLTASIVGRIFDEYLAGLGYYAIAERLTADGVPSPSGHDRARNPHRHGTAWGQSAVRAILRNPRYTGHEVWAKQRRDEVLVDVDDVSAGNRTVMRWNATDKWVWSKDPAHTALVPMDAFEAVQTRMASRAGSRGTRRPGKHRRHYLLRGRLRCSLCQRTLQGATAHGHTYYRCKFSTEYALSGGGHPKSVNLREDSLLPVIDEWLATVFHPENVSETCAAMASLPDLDDAFDSTAAERILRDCDQKLARYRSALEAGTDPTIVAKWIADVNAERRAAEKALDAGRSTQRQRVIAAELERAFNAIGGLVPLLAAADPLVRGRFYEAVGLLATYDPDQGAVDVEARVLDERVGGGT